MTNENDRAQTRRTSHRTIADLLRRLNPVLRGWCTYFRHAVYKRTFSHVDHFGFWRVVGRRFGSNMATTMVLGALEMALRLRGARRLIDVITDHEAGSRLTSVGFSECLDEIGARHPERHELGIQ